MAGPGMAGAAARGGRSAPTPRAFLGPSVPCRKSRSRLAGPHGPWLRCSSSTYVPIRLRRRALPWPAMARRGHEHDFRHETLVGAAPRARRGVVLLEPARRLGHVLAPGGEREP